MTAEKIVVSLRGIRKEYADHVAVQDFSLDMHHGEIVCLLGPSGCGKTTTLRMVAGFVEPTAGTVLIEGKDVTHAPPYRRDTGMVFQSYALFPHMTVGQNIAFGLEQKKIPADEKAKRVAEMLELIEMPHLKDRLPKQLSGGQQQRVALARALAVRPAVLLLDEPFSNLDARLRVRLREEMRNLIKQVNITTLFVTHDQDEALAVADRIVVMSKGVVEQIGTPVEVYEHPATEFVAGFIGTCTTLQGNIYTQGVFISRQGFTYRCDAPPGPATFIVRPEYMHLPNGAANETVHEGTVLSASYLGHKSRILIACNGEKFVMEEHFPRGTTPSAGDKIRFVIDAAGVQIIRKEN